MGPLLSMGTCIIAHGMDFFINISVKHVWSAWSAMSDEEKLPSHFMVNHGDSSIYLSDMGKFRGHLRGQN